MLDRNACAHSLDLKDVPARQNERVDLYSYALSPQTANTRAREHASSLTCTRQNARTPSLSLDQKERICGHGLRAETSPRLLVCPLNIALASMNAENLMCDTATTIKKLASSILALRWPTGCLPRRSFLHRLLTCFIAIRSLLAASRMRRCVCLFGLCLCWTVVHTKAVFREGTGSRA